MKIRKGLIYLLLLLAVASAAWAQTGVGSENLPAGSATIVDLKGEVLITLSGQTTPTTAQKGQALGPNTLIECRKGTVLLALADGSQVLVKDRTRVILRVPDEAQGNFLEQLMGKVVATVKKRVTGDPPFKMGTPTAVITVRGTKFMVEVNKSQRTFVEVFEGLVEVAGLRSGAPSVVLQPGYFTQVNTNLPPDTPRRLLDEAQREDSGGITGSRHGRESEDPAHKQPNSTGNNGGQIDD